MNLFYHPVLAKYRLSKLWKIMRVTTLLLLIGLMQTYATSTYSQNTKLSLKMENASLESILNEIEKISEFHFFYKSSEINQNARHNVDVKEQTVDEVLNTLIGNSDLTYRIFDKYIAIVSKENANESIANLMQQKVVSGKVTDAAGASLPGSSVIVKGTTNGVVTDNSGNYSISVPENATLQFSFVGMKMQEITVAGKTSINVSLVEDAIGIEEVVAIGYGTQKKANLTGAVEVVSSERLENRPAPNITALLQGNTNGIVFSPPSGGFSPGAAQVMQIRGSGSLSGTTPPLIVIDGIPTDISDFNALNPNDVESISVLKDAAASAIYGARAPYGVLLVTLKKGKRSQKPVFMYSGNYSVVQPINYPDPTDSYTFALAKNEAYLNTSQSAYFNASQLATIKGNVEHPENYTIDQLVPLLNDGSWGWGDNGLCNTNWFDVWLKDSHRQSHDLAVRGGTEKTSYFASVGYLDQPGIFNYMAGHDNYKRFSITGGFNTDINEWIKFGFHTRYSMTNTLAPSQGMDLLYGYMYGAYPVIPVKNPNGEYNQSSRIKPYLVGGNSTNDQHRLDNVLELDLNPVKGWDIHVDGTWRVFAQDYEKLSNPYVYNYYKDGRTVLGSEGSIAKTYNINTYWTAQAYTSYNKTINKHYFKIQGGMQAEELNNRGLSGSGQKMLIPDSYSINLSQTNKTTSDALSSWSTVGFFGRLNYNFDERYLIEINGRYDGSCRYSSENRWGFFPSASVGWVMSKENFWEKIEPIVNYAKIRTSIGTLGDQGNTASFLYIPTLTVSPNSSWVFGNATVPYVNTPGILNPEITWTKISTFDIGADLKFLDNRLSTEFDWFRRKSWDILGPPNPVPSVLGTSAPQINNSEFVTKGFELLLGWNDRISDKWDYSVRIGLSDASSTITKYNVAKNYVGQWYPGMKLGDIWGYSSKGLLDAADFNTDGSLKVSQSQLSTKWYLGDVKYEDLDGDEKITTGDGTIDKPGDRKIIANSTPRYNYSMNLNLGYTFKKAGRLDLSMLWQGVGKWMQAGNYSFYYWGMGSESGNNSDVNVYTGAKQLDFYRDDKSSPELIAHLGTNTDAFFPRPYVSSGGFKNFQPSDRYLINRAYLRLKNIQLSYTLPTEWLRKAKLQSCQIYFSGENLLTFQDSSLPYYIDPEIPSGGRSYVQQATYSCGINLGF
jgi:TonB-linked SusC/RagA family outer membrane protein